MVEFGPEIKIMELQDKVEKMSLQVKLVISRLEILVDRIENLEEESG